MRYVLPLALAGILVLAPPARSADQRAAVEMVKGFYDVYLRLAEARPLQRLDALHSRLEPGLYDLLRRSFKETDSGPGFDPFTVLPGPVDGVAVEPLAAEGTEARVRVRVFSPFGNHVLELFLRDSPAGWRVANAVYQDGRDLLTLLRGG